MSRWRRVLGAALVGVGSVLVPKTDPREHWSIAPKVEIVADDAGAEAPGDGNAS